MKRFYFTSQRLSRLSTGAALMCLLLSMSIHAQQAVAVPAAITSAADKAPAPLDDRYRIGPGDILDIRVFNRPQLSRDAVRVDQRGMIRLPLIDTEIQAGCRTESELAQEVVTRYLKYQRRPSVDVFIKEYNSMPVSVMGAVAKPGQFQLQRRVRLLELLALAGGATERAGVSLLIVHGAESAPCSANPETVPSEATTDIAALNLNDTIKGVEQANPFVTPGDIITIPEAAQIYVVGNVLKPSAISLKEPVTLSQALAMAGGLLPDSKKDKIQIVRQTPGSTKRTEIVADLNAIKNNRSLDIELQANDIVEVQTSSGKRFLRSLLNSVIPGASQLPLRVVR